jgi:hypothetical protein
MEFIFISVKLVFSNVTKKILVLCILPCIYRSLFTFRIRERNARRCPVSMRLPALPFITELCLSFVSAALPVPLNPKYDARVGCIRIVFKSRWQHSNGSREQIFKHVSVLCWTLLSCFNGVYNYGAGMGPKRGNTLHAVTRIFLSIP